MYEFLLFNILNFRFAWLSSSRRQRRKVIINYHLWAPRTFELAQARKAMEGDRKKLEMDQLESTLSGNAQPSSFRCEQKQTVMQGPTYEHFRMTLRSAGTHSAHPASVLSPFTEWCPWGNYVQEFILRKGRTYWGRVINRGKWRHHKKSKWPDPG